MTAVSALDEFQEQRQRLFGIAYRMLGSATDAEDVLQDAWLRWQGVDRGRWPTRRRSWRGPSRTCA